MYVCIGVCVCVGEGQRDRLGSAGEDGPAHRGRCSGAAPGLGGPWPSPIPSSLMFFRMFNQLVYVQGL
ncbi:hypothetical protein HanIR_Chr14g0706741 [Helianthus annuus]|nr:hypothetical protein HanIR_Chr14g0706741 [Helianthus annuus]